MSFTKSNDYYWNRADAYLHITENTLEVVRRAAWLSYYIGVVLRFHRKSQDLV